MTSLRNRVRTGLLGCAVAVISLVAISLVVLIVVAAVSDRVGLLLSVTAASIPALIYATIVLRLDRYETEPLRAVLAFARDEIDSILDGLVYGALVGVGFAMTENILYFGQAYLEGGLGEFGTLVLSRAVLGGFGHPAYTAITGAAIGWSRGRHGRGIARVIVPVLGWALAVTLHVAWNGGLVLTSVTMDEEAGLLKLVAVQTAIVIVPAVLVLYATARMSARHELKILRGERGVGVERRTMTRGECTAIVDAGERRRARATAQARGGRALRRGQQAFFQTAADLALRSHHRHQGEPSKPRLAAQDDEDREHLLELRHELAQYPVLGDD